MTHHHGHDGDVDEPARCAVNPTHRLRDDEIGSCLACIARTRTLILEIVEGAAHLPDAIATLTGIRYDHGGGGHAKDDAPVVGGDALVLLAGGTTGTPVPSRRGEWDHLADAYPSDPPSLHAVLVDLETDWRRHLGHTLDAPTSDPAAYLLAHNRQAGETYPAYPENVDDLRRLHTRVMVVTGRQDTPEPLAAPCMHCGGRIVRGWADDGLSDTLECEGCAMTWDHPPAVPPHLRGATAPAAYRLAVADAIGTLPWDHPGALVTLDQAKVVLKPHGVRPNLLDVWRHRGVIRPEVGEDGRALRDVRGQALYRLEVLAVRAGVLLDGAALDDLLARVDTPAARPLANVADQ